MELTRELVEWNRVALGLGGALLALLWARLPGGARRPALAVLVLSGFLNYSRLGTDVWTKRVDVYDLLHYYVNAKYADELGYLDLYPAILQADAENGGPFFPQVEYMAQDETGHHRAPVAEGIARGRVVRDTRFTPARWEAFVHDVLVLQRELGCRDRSKRTRRCLRELNPEMWNELVLDHGFNGTPAWTVLAQPLANAVPVGSVKLLGYLDVALLLAALAAVGWASGGDAALWTALFLLVTYSTRWPYLSWGFLRYDWIAGLLLATAFLRRPGGRWGAALAGIFAGWAAVLRFFPAMWMWGPLCRGLWGLWERELRRPLLVLAGTFLLSVGALQAAATARYGPAFVAEHFENMMDHNRAEQLSSRRIGLALALATEPWTGMALEERISDETRARVEAQAPLRYVIAAVSVVALGFGLRRKGDDEAFAWGFLPFFAFTTASYYYYVARAPLVAVHAAGLDGARHRAGLAVLLALEAGSSALEVGATGHRMLLIGLLAWSLAAYAVLQVGWMILQDRRGAPPG